MPLDRRRASTTQKKKTLFKRMKEDMRTEMECEWKDEIKMMAKCRSNGLKTVSTSTLYYDVNQYL